MRGIHCFANGRTALKAFGALAIVTLAAGAGAQSPAQWKGTPIALAPEPDSRRILASPTLLWNIPASARKADRALEVTFISSAPAELELATVYGKSTFVNTRRTVIPGMSAGAIWEIPQSDTATSVTLAVRCRDTSATVTIQSMRLLPLDELSLALRLAAFTQYPLRPMSAAVPVNGDVLMVEFEFPESLRSTLSKSSLSIETSSGGKSNSEPISVALEARKDRGAVVPDLFAVKVPPGSTGNLDVRLVFHGEKGVEQLATTTIELKRPTLPFFEVPLRSIEDFTAFERNGELVIYACTADAGQQQGSAGIPLAADSVWVTAGNGADWVFIDPMLRTLRDGDWMAGGPTAISAVAVGGAVHALFTTVSAEGRETLSYAGATGSARLTPVAKNPIWAPAAADVHSAPLLRGKALFELNGSRVVLELLLRRGAEPEVRTLVANMKTRWNDLGSIPLPELPRDTAWLTGYQESGGNYYLLAGPTTKLYRAANPMRDWKAIPFAAPHWEGMQLVRWNGTDWLFGIQRFNGRGVVVWAPADREGDGFRVREKFQFNPVPPAKSNLPPPPPPPPARAETDVR